MNNCSWILQSTGNVISGKVKNWLMLDDGGWSSNLLLSKLLCKVMTLSSLSRSLLLPACKALLISVLWLNQLEQWMGTTTSRTSKRTTSFGPRLADQGKVRTNGHFDTHNLYCTYLNPLLQKNYSLPSTPMWMNQTFNISENNLHWWSIGLINARDKLFLKEHCTHSKALWNLHHTSQFSTTWRNCTAILPSKASDYNNTFAWKLEVCTL
jgi:hypothetical protein